MWQRNKHPAQALFASVRAGVVVVVALIGGCGATGDEAMGRETIKLYQDALSLDGGFVGGKVSPYSADGVGAPDATPKQSLADAGGSFPDGSAADAAGGSAADAAGGAASVDGASVDGASGSSSSGGSNGGSSGGAACPGGANCGCAVDNDCASGLCVEVLGAKVCATPCSQGCPAGLQCKSVKPAGAAAVSLCLPKFPRLCDPCQADSDCTGALGAEANRCAAHVDNKAAQKHLLGHFCVPLCAVDADCPQGHHCDMTTSPGGGAFKACIKTDHTCGCSARAVKNWLSTACAHVTAAGSCAGTRFCSAAGLTKCSASLAAAEVCDGKDNDCDGFVDEKASCDDGNPCTDDSCSNGACAHPSSAAKACDDGDPCSLQDTCVNGACKPAKTAVCDDGNACTQDTCLQPAGCKFVAVDGAPCDDGHACTVQDKCKSAMCAMGKLKSCHDGNPCTKDSCHATKGCLHAALSWLACNDGDACTTGDKCAHGKCKSGPLAKCNDGNACTVDTCKHKGVCVHAPHKGSCNDGNACTLKDTCHSGACKAGKKASCHDGNVCTQDSCHAKKGCLFVPTKQACNDGNACTKHDKCSAGACKGAARNCNDGNACTVDTCSATKGCQHKSSVMPCSDGDACTQNDACLHGDCVGGPKRNCDDGNPCTVDACLKSKGCVHATNIGACTAPIYRFYMANSKTEDHRFSPHKSIGSGYKKEGLAMRLFQSRYKGTKRLFQAFSSQWKDHLQTTSAKEGKPLYKAHKVLGYCYDTPRKWAKKPLYRLWKKKTKTHFITISASERNAAIKKGYKYEGVVCYARDGSL